MPLSSPTYATFGRRYQREEQKRLSKIDNNGRIVLMMLLKYGSTETSAYRTLFNQNIRARRQIDEVLRPEWKAISAAAEDARDKQFCLYNELNANNTRDPWDKPREDNDPNYWHSHFRFLSEVPEDDVSDVLETMHPSKVERILRSWCSDFTVPQDDLSPSVSPLHSLVIDPSMIKDDLAIRLGLIEYDEKDSPLDRLHKKESLECTAGLKELIVQSEPLYPNDFRFLILPDGRLLYFSERVSSREYDPRTRLRVSLYDSAYDALEKTHHQSVQHAQETEQLTDTSVALTATISRFDRWRKDSPDDHKVVLRAEAAELPEDHNYLFGALSEDKTDAGGFIVSASTVTDARGSENPSATMSQLVAARNRLGNRDDSIRGVESYNSRDAHDIAKVIDEHEKLLLKFRQDLQENAYKIDDPNHSLFTDDLIGGAQSSARDMMFCLKIDPKPLRDIILEPFKTYTECILRQYEVLETALMERDQETARSALLRMHLIGKFQGVRKCFTGIKRDIIEPEYTTLFAIRDKLNLLKSYIERYQLFDGVIDAEYEPHFIELEERIDALLASVQNSLADTDDQQHDQRTSPFSDIYKELYDLIEEYDIEDIVSKLPCGKSIIESK